MLDHCRAMPGITTTTNYSRGGWHYDVVSKLQPLVWGIFIVREHERKRALEFWGCGKTASDPIRARGYTRGRGAGIGGFGETGGKRGRKGSKAEFLMNGLLRYVDTTTYWQAVEWQCGRGHPRLHQETAQTNASQLTIVFYRPGRGLRTVSIKFSSTGMETYTRRRIWVEYLNNRKLEKRTFQRSRESAEHGRMPASSLPWLLSWGQ
jgi:hypothetical protein